MTRGQILRDALEVINGERQDMYGDPEDSFALIADYWNVYLREQNHDFNDLDSKDIAYMMTLFKLAREAHQHKRDNLIDAAGYLGIAGDMHNVNETDFVKNEGRYTDEELDHNCRPSDMPYANIPVTEQEDEAFEVLSVRR